MRLKEFVYQNPLYNVVKKLMFTGLFRSGIVHLFRRNRRDSVLVLIYHDVLPSGFPEHNPLFGMTVSTTEFEWQLAYVRRYYNPITFQQFADWFLKEAPLPPYPVLITFDDGHSNNFDFALPVLSKLGIPAICFVVSGSLGLRTLTWFEDAYYRLMFSTAAIWKLRNGEVWPLTTDKQRAEACGRFFLISRCLKEAEQREELKSLRSQLQLGADREFPGRFSFLSEQQLHSLLQRVSKSEHTR
ncbi:MAG: polysaccharide deacetylase [Acidobacteriaceae bacterium]|nr:polysaccharide deacetylase [Acidobacteriaceae bacterium]